MRLGVQFRQQVSIERYYLDFLILPNIVVEAEGKVHAHRQDRDADRTERLETLGYRVFRIPNYMIFEDPKGIAQMIEQQSQREEMWRVSNPPEEAWGIPDCPELGRGNLEGLAR